MEIEEFRKLLEHLERAGYVIVTTHDGRTIIRDKDMNLVTVVTPSPMGHYYVALRDLVPLKQQRGFRWPPWRKRR